MGMATQRIPTKIQRQKIDDYFDGITVSYEQTITSGQQVLNFAVDSGRAQAHGGYFINDGPGDLQFEISSSGDVYGGIHTMKPAEQLDLGRFSIAKMRITWVENTSYRALMI